MNKIQAATDDILPSNPIRVETALSRYPVHRLAKHGDISIDICEMNKDGELFIRWEVDYSRKHGQPGPLAYKLDTIIINRKIEEATRPIPRIIKLGSLRDMCRELGQSEGENVNSIRKALRQNAFAGITARIRYRQNDGSERTLEADFTRYSVVFTGENLPDGRKADAVYIVLNDIYMQVINGAMTRPLNYDYLKSLPPAPQRFYELLSYQMYAAIKNDRPRAKLLYSELCKYSPLTRHLEWLRVRTQMNKIYRPHKDSGYIARIDYEQTVDADGHPDWIMLYQPGPKARAEFRAFAKRGGPTILEMEPFAAIPSAPVALQQAALPLMVVSPLEKELTERGITTAIAAALVQEHPEGKIRLQIEILDWRMSKKSGKPIDDPAAYLVSAIRSGDDGHAVPKGFISAAERQRREDAKRNKEQQDAEEKRREREQQARERAERQAIKTYWESLTAEQQQAHDAEAIAQADAKARELIEPGPMKRIGMGILRDRHTRRLLQIQGKLPVSEE